MSNLFGDLPECVATERVSHVNQAEIYERAIKESQSEIFGVIQDPSAVFSDHGLLLVGAAFKTNPDIHIIQTERLRYGIEGVEIPIRHELPEWSQALLLDPICLARPSMLFDWRGVFMRRETRLNHALPLEACLPFATALDAASKIVRRYQIHSLRAPVVVDDYPLEARSFLFLSLNLLMLSKLLIAKGALLKMAFRMLYPISSRLRRNAITIIHFQELTL